MQDNPLLSKSECSTLGIRCNVWNHMLVKIFISKFVSRGDPPGLPKRSFRRSGLMSSHLARISWDHLLVKQALYRDGSITGYVPLPDGAIFLCFVSM
jgi:hypothetical protein